MKFGRQRDWIKKFNWREKNLRVENSQSRSHGPELRVYEHGSSPTQGIWRNTLIKMIACDRLVP